MKKLLFPGLILFSITLLVSCCKKEEPQPWYETVPRYYMNEEFKSYFAPAGEGSWYVYYDSQRGMYDTLTIVEVSHPLGFYGGFDESAMDHVGENYSVTYKSTYKEDPSHDNTLNWALGCVVEPPGGHYNPDEVMYIFRINGGASNGPRISYGEKSGYDITDYKQKITYAPEVELQGVVYKDVLKIEEDGLFKPIWFAKGIGPIRRVHSAARTKDFQLIDYHLEPNPMGETMSNLQ